MDSGDAPTGRKHRRPNNAQAETIDKAIRQQRHKSETIKRLKGQRKKPTKPVASSDPATVLHKQKVAKLRDNYQKSADELQAKLADVERLNNELKEAVKGKSESEANHLLTLPREEFDGPRPIRTCICGKHYTSFPDIPPDLTMQIFRFLDSTWSHFVLRRVCRDWYKMLEHSATRHNVRITHTGLMDTVEALDKESAEKLPDNIVRALSNVTLTEHVTGLTISLAGYSAPPCFEVLYARDADLADCMEESEHCLEEVVQRCPHLRSIAVIQARVSFAQILNIPSGTHFSDLQIRMVDCVLADDDLVEEGCEPAGILMDCAASALVKDGTLVFPADCIHYHEKRRRLERFLDDMTPPLSDKDIETLYRFMCAFSGFNVGSRSMKQFVKTIINRREQTDDLDADIANLSSSLRQPLDKLSNIGWAQLRAMRPSTLRLLFKLATADCSSPL
ncbi:uncharacterized protein LOC129596169 [Paramacrobiotus metropolitanus]|uniref:uncharacterized protein LOC129596169 n=1 Tax=Paramacrobiotus metropolitanus TaxID=2943436 RepID=UPI002445D3B9|nr:uncharacterized protein LOC129596169 [Paramacrobiotus metropolitanus]